VNKVFSRDYAWNYIHNEFIVCIQLKILKRKNGMIRSNGIEFQNLNWKQYKKFITCFLLYQSLSLFPSRENRFHASLTGSCFALSGLSPPLSPSLSFPSPSLSLSSLSPSLSPYGHFSLCLYPSLYYFYLYLYLNLGLSGGDRDLSRPQLSISSLFGSHRCRHPHHRPLASCNFSRFHLSFCCCCCCSSSSNRLDLPLPLRFSPDTRSRRIPFIGVCY